MEILTRQKCTECDGVGVVYHPAWAEFNAMDEAHRKETGKWMDMDQADIEKWFREKGYGKLPPEEPNCFECEGKGVIEKWMDIKEVLELANIIG